MYKLGKPMKDKVTGLEGMLTHLQVEGKAGFMIYMFQPRGLNPETKQPVDCFWLTPDRIHGGIEVDEPYLARDVIGTEVEDMASGFRGTAVAAILHINGCLHIDVQPPGVVEKTGAKIKTHNFDIRRLQGERVPLLDDEALEKSKAATPSPEDVTSWLR